MTPGFSQQFFEKYTNFMKIRQVRTELLRADGRTNGSLCGRNEANSRIS